MTLPKHVPDVAALVLAAGQSRRMGTTNKLLAKVGQSTMVAGVVDTLCRCSMIQDIIVVTGYQRTAIETALRGKPVRFVHNPHYSLGLSTSLRAGVPGLRNNDGALVCLADMPKVNTEHIDKLVAAFGATDQSRICVPVYAGRRGNPVLWPRRFFAELAATSGDVGARHLIRKHGSWVLDVPMNDDGVLFDIDTPDALGAV